MLAAYWYIPDVYITIIQIHIILYFLRSSTTVYILDMSNV